MTKKTTETAVNAPAPQAAVGLVMEMEFMLFAGRRLLFEAYGSVLKTHGLALDQMLFTRYCQKRKIEKNLKTLLSGLGKKGLAEAELAEKIKERFQAALLAPANAPAPQVLELLQKAAERQIKIGLLSFLPDDPARQLLARLALNPPAGLQIMCKEADNLPTPDAWLALLKTMARPARSVIALVDGAQACKSALTVGMRCVVLPDGFTAWQDYSGADRVLENISELKLDELVAMLSPAHYRIAGK